MPCCHRCGGFIEPDDHCALITGYLRDGAGQPVPVIRNFHSPCAALFDSEQAA